MNNKHHWLSSHLKADSPMKWSHWLCSTRVLLNSIYYAACFSSRIKKLVRINIRILSKFKRVISSFRVPRELGFNVTTHTHIHAQCSWWLQPPVMFTAASYKAHLHSLLSLCSNLQMLLSQVGFEARFNELKVL